MTATHRHSYCCILQATAKHTSHCFCMRTTGRCDERIATSESQVSYSAAQTRQQHASDRMLARVAVCDFMLRACMCRHGADTMVVGASEAPPAIPRPEKPVRRQRQASGDAASVTAQSGLERRDGASSASPLRRCSGPGPLPEQQLAAGRGRLAYEPVR